MSLFKKPNGFRLKRNDFEFVMAQNLQLVMTLLLQLFAVKFSISKRRHEYISYQALTMIYD